MSTYLSTYWTLFDHLVDYNSTSLIRSCPSCYIQYIVVLGPSVVVLIPHTEVSHLYSQYTSCCALSAYWDPLVHMSPLVEWTSIFMTSSVVIVGLLWYTRGGYWGTEGHISEASDVFLGCGSRSRDCQAGWFLSHAQYIINVVQAQFKLGWRHFRQKTKVGKFNCNMRHPAVTEPGLGQIMIFITGRGHPALQWADASADMEPVCWDANVEENRDRDLAIMVTWWVL